MRVAVVGSDVAGLTAARALAQAGANVVLYEKENFIGGHTFKSFHSEHDGVDLDIGFMPFNQASYPSMMKNFEEVGVQVEGCEMSFGVSLTKGRIFEWSSRGLAGLFTQKRNAIDPYFWNMIREILKFGADASRYLQRVDESDSSLNPNETLGDFLDSHGYSKKFREDYLIPICASIWSCTSELVLTLSAVPILTFCRDHKPLQLSGYSQWLIIKGSHEAYARKVIEDLKNAGAKMRISTAVTHIKTLDGGNVQLTDDNGVLEVFDKCIVSAPAPDALQMRAEDATLSEKNFLGVFKYVDCDVVLHRDEAFMPKRKTAWSTWNFTGDKSGRVCVTYWLNHIQNMGHTGLHFLLTLNPPRTPQLVEQVWRTRQLVPTPAATNAIKQLASIQGRHGIWYCVPYQGFGSGLSGDAIKCGLETARELLCQKFEASAPLKAIVPSWSEYAAKRSVIPVLRKFISTGTLRIVEVGGEILDFIGDEKGCNMKITMQLNNPAFYWKIASRSDLGLAESYIDGDFSFPDDGRKSNNLCNFIELIIANLALAKAIPQDNQPVDQGWWKPLFATATLGQLASYLGHILRDNSITGSRKNIAEHYDMSNELFELFLDETMTYSCGIFQEPTDTLKDAQLRKLRLLIDKARIKSTYEVLEIGCGWGSMAIELVRRTGCRYTGLTLSTEQLKEAQKRVKAAGLEDRINFLICDYRLLPGAHKFDRIIACEMIEHLGHHYQKTFFDRCDYLLAKDGLVILQSSSLPDEGYDSYRRSSDFIKVHVFPGANIPCLSVLATAASSKFTLEHFDNIGPHYVKTLLTWQENFQNNTSEVRRLGFNDRFIRKMEYYFSYCAAGFRTCQLGCLQAVFSRPRNAVTLGNPSICFPPVLSSHPGRGVSSVH